MTTRAWFAARCPAMSLGCAVTRAADQPLEPVGGIIYTIGAGGWDSRTAAFAQF